VASHHYDMQGKHCSIRGSSYHWVGGGGGGGGGGGDDGGGGGVVGDDSACIHGRRGDQRVSQRVHGGGAGTQRRADSDAGLTLGRVFHRLASCDGERESERERIY